MFQITKKVQIFDLDNQKVPMFDLDNQIEVCGRH